jgi:hypothetical protein
MAQNDEALAIKQVALELEASLRGSGAALGAASRTVRDMKVQAMIKGAATQPNAKLPVGTAWVWRWALDGRAGQWAQRPNGSPLAQVEFKQAVEQLGRLAPGAADLLPALRQLPADGWVAGVARARAIMPGPPPGPKPAPPPAARSLFTPASRLLMAPPAPRLGEPTPTRQCCTHTTHPGLHPAPPLHAPPSTFDHAPTQSPPIM